MYAIHNSIQQKKKVKIWEFIIINVNKFDFFFTLKSIVNY